MQLRATYPAWQAYGGQGTEAAGPGGMKRGKTEKALFSSASCISGLAI
jgi:hypothetical protein